MCQKSVVILPKKREDQKNGQKDKQSTMYRKLKTEQNAPNKALCIQKTKD